MKYAVFDLMNKRKTWLLFFLTGISIGTIYANIKWFDCLSEVDAFITYWGDRIENANIDRADFQIYILKNRLKEVLLILLFNMTIVGKFFNCGYLAYAGYSSAVVETLFALKYGYKSILLYSMSVFPHYIVYAVLIIYAFVFCEKVNDMFFKDRTYTKRMRISDIKIIAADVTVILALIWLESMLEAYININVLIG